MVSEFLEWAGRQSGGFGSPRDRVYDRDMITSWAEGFRGNWQKVVEVKKKIFIKNFLYSPKLSIRDSLRSERRASTQYFLV